MNINLLAFIQAILVSLYVQVALDSPIGTSALYMLYIYLRYYGLGEQAPVEFPARALGVAAVELHVALVAPVSGRRRGRDALVRLLGRHEDDRELVPGDGELDEGDGQADQDLPAAEVAHRPLHGIAAAFLGGCGASIIIASSGRRGRLGILAVDNVLAVQVWKFIKDGIEPIN